MNTDVKDDINYDAFRTEIHDFVSKNCPSDIKEIMAKANKAGGLFPQIQKGLKAPAPNWANLKNDSDELVSLATMLGKSKPPKGDAASWATMSKGYLDEATALKTAIAAMNKAGADAAIGKLATSCTGCHKAHKN